MGDNSGLLVAQNPGNLNQFRSFLVDSLSLFSALRPLSWGPVLLFLLDIRDAKKNVVLFFILPKLLPSIGCALTPVPLLKPA